jgi:Rrf2 family protein
MKLTKASEYGILTMLHLAKQPAGQLSDTARIAESQKIPTSFLVKLVPTLVKAGLVRSHRGSNGGLELARPAESITLRHIIEATEGEIAINDCTSSNPYACFRAGCAIQGALRVAQNQFLAALDGFTLAGLVTTDKFTPQEVALTVLAT